MDKVEPEEAFSKIKSIVRKVGVRTPKALIDAIASALSAITPGTSPDGSIIAATTSRFNTYEHRCEYSEARRQKGTGTRYCWKNETRGSGYALP
jgi:hypothetical protein